MNPSLCQIPSCRIRGRHKPDCPDPDDCRGCLPRVAEEGLACDWCTGRAAAQLETVIELGPPAALVAAGLARVGGAGSGSSKPESRPPLNPEATDKLTEVKDGLDGLTAAIARRRNLRPPAPGARDPRVVAARWLLAELPWIRHALTDQGSPYAIEAYAEIRDCASRIRGILDGPAAQKYLGPCGAEIETCGVGWIDDGDHWSCDLPSDHAGEQHEFRDQDLPPCDGDVYGRPNAEKGRCRTCGAEVDQGERRAWLDDEVRQYSYTPSEITDAYPSIKRNTINQWAARGRLIAQSRDWTGRARYNLGDVLDLAAADAARRESARATRGRREAAKVTEGATA